ncbi:MAG: hypothetical protein IJ228_01760 [Succinivibrio sp.]|nr:hypothetical protein [Succinivibrio sp.]
MSEQTENESVSAEATAKSYRARALAWDSGKKDENGNPIININRSGHVSSNDPEDDSKARHATAYSVHQVKQSLDTLDNGMSDRITSVVNAKIQSGEIAAGGSAGSSDVAVVGTPKIYGDFAIIGSATTFTLTSYAGLQGATIDHFKVSLTGCEEQTVQASGNAATVLFSIPTSTDKDAELTMKATAYDSNGSSSFEATKTIIATEAAVGAPTVTAPAAGDVIVYNEGFQVQGTPMSMMGTGEDTHVASKVIIRDHALGTKLKEVTFDGAVTICQLQASDMPGLGSGHVYDVSLQYQGKTYGWGVESMPVAVTLNSAIRAPAIIQPVSGGSFHYVAGLPCRAEPFTTDFYADTLELREWQLRDQFGNVLLTREVTHDGLYDFGDLTGIVGTGAVRLYCRDKGVKYGYGEYTGPVTLTSLPTSGILSSFLSPVEGATVVVRNGLSLILDTPGVSGGDDAVSNSDLQVCTGADGSGILLGATTESGSSHVFSASEVASKLTVGQSFYARGRQNLKTGESLGFGTALFVVNSGIDTPSGRLVYPFNSKLIGFEFNYQGKTRRLLVAKGAYRARNSKQWRDANTVVNGLFQFAAWDKVTADGKTYIYRVKDGNNIPQFASGNTATLNCAAEATIGPVTDAQLNAWLLPAYQNENKTARECGDIILSECGAGHAPAIEYCRSLDDLISGGMDLPLIHDACALYIEGDAIDALDDTLADYPDNCLGRTNNKNRFLNGRVWCCQQWNGNYAVYLASNSSLGSYNKTHSYCAVPVREI